MKEMKKGGGRFRILDWLNHKGRKWKEKVDGGFGKLDHAM